MSEPKGSVRKVDTDSNVRNIGGEVNRHSIRMTADRILVVTPKEIGERKSRGGILIPATIDSESRRAMWGEVVAIGPMVRSAEAGDLVLFGPETAYEVEIRDEDYVVLRERDIHAVASGRTEGKTGLYL